MHAELEICQHLRQELISRQLPEGGWPYTQGSSQAALEPSCLALLALCSDKTSAADMAIRFLLAMQNSNGSWPAFAGDGPEGSGLTGLALLALSRCGVKGEVTDRGFQWLLNLRGWESHWLWRWKFKTSDRHVRFDPDKFGWPWIPQTVSWVVPTAYSLLALKERFGNFPAGLVRFRIRRGVEMLYDRSCPQGGWNAGNGVVYGHPLAPHVDTTAVALLALRDEPTYGLTADSLAWLEHRARSCSPPWSLAWAILALDAHGLPTYPLFANFAKASERGEIKDNATLAVASLAFDCALERNPFKARA